MRAVIQRVSRASVTVEEKCVAAMQSGLLVLLGIEEADSMEDVQWLAAKIVNLRIFADEKGVMNIALNEHSGDCIVVSQFTLHALTKKGNRPSYIRAARPEHAMPMYEAFVQEMERLLGKSVGKGIFGADMQVDLCNDGPVTILIDTKNRE